MKRYAELIDYFIHTESYVPIPISRQHVVVAGETVLRLYPPSDAATTFQMLASLNLLNAAVKLSWGRKLVGYSFIKGYAGLLFQHVNEQHIQDVETYWERAEHIAYFRVYNVQISFHYIIMSARLVEMLPRINCRPQTWSGLQLQEVAVEVFLLACPTALDGPYNPCSPVNPAFFECPQHRDRLVQRVLPHEGYKRFKHKIPKCEHSTESLSVALHFNIWRTDCFTLFRKLGKRFLRVMRYDGSNAHRLNEYLLKPHPLVCPREEYTLFRGKHYYVSPQLHLMSVAPSRYVRLLTHYAYLVDGNRCRNLCITYDIALWLALHYPSLYFVNILNANRDKVHTCYHKYNSLLRVPPHSKARRLRVWVVIDNDWVLRGFNIGMLPADLVEDYLQSEEFWNDYQVVCRKKHYGIYAHGRFHLLDTIYKKIHIHNNYASVTRDDGKKAIYSLGQERFVTKFLFDRFLFDTDRFTLYGIIGKTKTVIFTLHPQQPFCYLTS